MNYHDNQRYEQESLFSVRFAPYAELYEYETNENPKELWYNSQEYSRFEVNRRIDVMAFTLVEGDASRLDSSIHCIRGLEGSVSEYFASQVLRRRARVLRAVVGEQSRQIAAGVVDPSRLAYAYSRHTGDCRVEARERASMDALAVKKIDEVDGKGGYSLFNAPVDPMCSTLSPMVGRSIGSIGALLRQFTSVLSPRRH
eukprot:Nitzschia sp. Nitz4//scaffold152_size53828//45402//46075//NITZ4_006751-RA/size53828-augustus-gene-0.94-mRNA-1//1//CDS//3329537229//1337//frame0